MKKLNVQSLWDISVTILMYQSILKINWLTKAFKYYKGNNWKGNSHEYLW